MSHYTAHPFQSMHNKLIETIGTAFGFAFGGFKSISIAEITWSAAWETLVFSAEGALVGCIVAVIFSTLSKRFKKWISKRF
jgi:ABC-type phosphate/phosphonate transport system permease subunit